MGDQRFLRVGSQWRPVLDVQPVQLVRAPSGSRNIGLV